MSGQDEDAPPAAKVRLMKVAKSENEVRLDRWFKRHFPHVNHIALEKLLRTGQVRLDGKRVKSNERLRPGQEVRVPPLPEADAKPVKAEARVPDNLVKDLLARILYKDDDVLVLNKPFGLAVQGGTGTTMHLDAALDYLKFGAKERPRLVHRLDRDTAGVLVLARNVAAASKLGEIFRRHKVRKYYWAVTVGRPHLMKGRIDAALLKQGGDFERMEVNETEGQDAVTYYSIVESAERIAAWVALWPITGRTHQLRAHLAAIGHPILGDPKYGDKTRIAEIPNKLHLFARRLILPHPTKGTLDVKAPLPEHFKPAWDYFGFGKNDDDPFRDLEP